MTKEFESPLKPFYKGKAELTESHPMHIAVTSRLNNSEVPEDYQGVSGGCLGNRESFFYILSNRF